MSEDKPRRLYNIFSSPFSFRVQQEKTERMANRAREAERYESARNNRVFFF